MNLHTCHHFRRGSASAGGGVTGAGSPVGVPGERYIGSWEASKRRSSARSTASCSTCRARRSRSARTSERSSCVWVSSSRSKAVSDGVSCPSRDGGSCPGGLWLVWSRASRDGSWLVSRAVSFSQTCQVSPTFWPGSVPRLRRLRTASGVVPRRAAVWSTSITRLASRAGRRLVLSCGTCLARAISCPC